jgi:hypothetical protein
MFSEAKFPHRHNRDGSNDSICTTCLATVASVQNEEELGSYESAHVCDPINTYRISQDYVAKAAMPYC